MAFPDRARRPKGCHKMQLRGQCLPASAASTGTWPSRMGTGRRRRVLGPAFVFSALVSVSLALLLLREPASSYKTKNSPEPYCVN